MTITIRLLLIILTFVLISCCPDYDLTIYNGKSTQIKVNGNDLEEYICKVNSQTENKSSYTLALDVGNNIFTIQMNDGTVIDTTIVVGGELYLSIDLETKYLSGFD
ncbi:MAG: hypothetical protein CR986_09845 [Ignavibacteriae bacterium]|nr:MAG: hypothetical protein CR986_09845 [Ignavibacteriota bacterium]